MACPHPYFYLALLTALLPANVLAIDRPVNGKTQFTAAMAVVQPGDVIVWKDGTYDNQATITFEPVAQGTAGAPITLRPETPGGVIFRGNTKLAIGGHFLVVTGFRFDNSAFTFSGTTTAVSVIDFRAHSSVARHAYDCRVSQCTIVNYDNPAATSSSKWVLIYGARNRFDRNLVTGKRLQGSVLVVELNEAPDEIEAAHRIDRNIFADRTPGPGTNPNEYETVRVGTSEYSAQNARVTVERNWFHQCSGEAEFVSNKSCENRYLHNTFVECAGSLTLRHGRGCRVEGNVFLGNNVAGTGGIRVTNEDHLIVNNHLQALAGTAGTDYQAGLALMDGTTPATTNPDLSGSYVQVKNVLLAHNTLAGVTQPVVFGVGRGGSGRTQPPRDTTLAGNVLVGTQTPLFTVTHTPINISYLDNLVWGGATGLAANPELVVADPLLANDALGLARPAATSPVVDAAATQALLPGDLLDIDGALRPLTPRDIGADEVSAGTRPLAPLSAAECGPLWMQPLGPLALSLSLTPQRHIRVSIHAPGTAWARLLTLSRGASPGGAWSAVTTLAEADDDGLFSAVEDPTGFARLFWRATRP